jgi:hypothetical protein
MRAIFGLFAVLLTGCAAEQRPWLYPYYRPTTKIGGLTDCAKHHIPTISIIGYHSIDTHDRLVLVHDWSPEALRCNPDNPNRLADDRKFHRTKIHPVRGVITFCARCSWDYWHCVGGNRQLADSDVEQITSLALHDPAFRKPILHRFAVYSPNAVVVGGRDEQVGDVFTDIGLEKRDGRWVIAYPASSHRVVATGRDNL